MEKGLKVQGRVKAAISFNNAAAGFHNAGVMDKALVCATRALDHPSFKDAAEALLEKIRPSMNRTKSDAFD